MSIATLFQGVNWLAVVSLTLLSFVLGAFWHLPFIFGRVWASHLGTVGDRKPNPLFIFGLSGLLHFISILGLAFLLGPTVGPIVGLVWGLVIAILWILPSMAVTYIFAGRPFVLFAIDAGFYVVFYAVAGIVIGLWH